MGKSKISGAWGESLAAQYLQRKRYKLEAAGFQCKFGEIDLVVSNRKYLVFVEVKLRKNADFASAMEYVDRNKQDRLRITASMYLAKFPTEKMTRFDVIEIYAPDGVGSDNYQINHLEDAFQ